MAAVALYEGVRVSEIALRPLPRYLSAPAAGALCGLIAYKFPAVRGPGISVQSGVGPRVRVTGGKSVSESRKGWQLR